MAVIGIVVLAVIGVASFNSSDDEPTVATTLPPPPSWTSVEEAVVFGDANREPVSIDAWDDKECVVRVTKRRFPNPVDYEDAKRTLDFDDRYQLWVNDLFLNCPRAR